MSTLQLGICPACWEMETMIPYSPASAEKTEAEIFNEIWAERPHVSYLSGRNLDGYYRTDVHFNMFHHVLSKGKFPQYKTDKRNIILLDPEEHWLIHSGTKSMRDIYEKNTGASFSRLITIKNEITGNIPDDNEPGRPGNEC